MIYRLFTAIVSTLTATYAVKRKSVIHRKFTVHTALMIYRFSTAKFTAYLQLYKRQIFTVYLPYIYRLFTAYLPFIYRYSVHYDRCLAVNLQLKNSKFTADLPLYYC